MEILLKVIRNPINRSTRHEKLPDKWEDYQHKDKLDDGVTFNVKYLGSILVCELNDEGESYGDKISAEAVNTTVLMSKAMGKKLPKASLNVSPRGIRVINADTEELISDLDIYRISFCTADRVHGCVFAYIARNKDNETMECHAFLCPKRKIAQAVTLTVAESFKLAKEYSDLEEGGSNPNQNENLVQNSSTALSSSLKETTPTPIEPIINAEKTKVRTVDELLAL